MNPLFEAAQEVSEFMAERGWAHCVIGGLALLRWGEPRSTLDVDLSLLTGFGQEEQFARPLLRRFRGRIPNALQFALAHRVLLITASNGKDVDIAFAALPFEQEMMNRATAFEFAPGIVLKTCSAEDLFVMKVFSTRARDWLDAEGVVARQRDKLDREYIVRHLGILSQVKEDSAWLHRAQRLLEASKE
ncbi:MAG: hypothetical protein N2255_06390 [Kiritimatiellae bacterium]|nr:hypothetical protein [Kiritimatiellia bacterium]